MSGSRSKHPKSGNCCHCCQCSLDHDWLTNQVELAQLALCFVSKQARLRLSFKIPFVFTCMASRSSYPKVRCLGLRLCRICSSNEQCRLRGDSLRRCSLFFQNGNSRQRENISINEVRLTRIQAKKSFLDRLRAQPDKVDRQTIELRCGFAGWLAETENSMPIPMMY